MGDHARLKDSSFTLIRRSIDRDHRSASRVVPFERLRLTESTLLIVTSDNGGEPRATSNAPLRAGKGSLYDRRDPRPADCALARTGTWRCAVGCARDGSGPLPDHPRPRRSTSAPRSVGRNQFSYIARKRHYGTNARTLLVLPTLRHTIRPARDGRSLQVV